MGKNRKFKITAVQRGGDPLAAFRILGFSKPIGETGELSRKIKVRDAYEALLTGNCTPGCFDHLALSLNEAIIRAEEIGIEVYQPLLDAHVVLHSIKDVYKETSILELLPKDRETLLLGIEAWEAVLEASSVKQMQIAQNTMINRLRKQGLKV